MIYNSHAQGITKKFSGIKQIAITTSSSDIILTKGNSSDVEVQVEFTFSKNEYEPIFEQDGDVLKLKEEFHKNSVSGNSKWRLTIPDGMKVKSNSGSGNLEASDLKIDFKSSTGSGNYKWKNISGESSISTGSGDIRIDSFDGLVKVSAGSGNISLVDSKGDLNAGTGSGNIDIEDFKGTVKAGTGSGNVKAEKLSLVSKSSFGTGSGDVFVKLNGPLTSSISLGSGSGDAVLDCNGTKLEGLLVMSASKKHGKIVAPYKFDKTEEVNDNDDDVTVRKTVQLGSATNEIKISTGSGKAEVKN